MDSGDSILLIQLLVLKNKVLGQKVSRHLRLSTNC